MDIRGKKHICPFCNAMFYDMNKEIHNCPKCKKALSKDDELEFIKKNYSNIIISRIDYKIN